MDFELVKNYTKNFDTATLSKYLNWAKQMEDACGIWLRNHTPTNENRNLHDTRLKMKQQCKMIIPIIERELASRQKTLL